MSLNSIKLVAVFAPGALGLDEQSLPDLPGAWMPEKGDVEIAWNTTCAGYRRWDQGKLYCYTCPEGSDPNELGWECDVTCAPGSIKVRNKQTLQQPLCVNLANNAAEYQGAVNEYVQAAFNTPNNSTYTFKDNTSWPATCPKNASPNSDRTSCVCPEKGYQTFTNGNYACECAENYTFSWNADLKFNECVPVPKKNLRNLARSETCIMPIINGTTRSNFWISNDTQDPPEFGCSANCAFFDHEGHGYCGTAINDLNNGETLGDCENVRIDTSETKSLDAPFICADCEVGEFINVTGEGRDRKFTCKSCDELAVDNGEYQSFSKNSWNCDLYCYEGYFINDGKCELCASQEQTTELADPRVWHCASSIRI